MMVDISTSGEASPGHVCTGCGGCCRHFAYVRLSRADVDALERFTGLAREAFSDSSDTAGRERFMLFQANGDCIFLRTSGGGYACSVYEARSAKCRSYPVTAVQHERCRRNSNR